GLERRQREPVDLHEIRAHGPARQRFETERARAREQVEHARSAQGALEDGEPGLAHAVPGGPDRIPRGRLQTTTLELSGDYPDHPLPSSPPLPVRRAEGGMRNWSARSFRLRTSTELPHCPSPIPPFHPL